MNKLADGLFSALHSVENAKRRWDRRRRSGLTDQGLREAIAEEFGIQGGQSGPGRASISYSGGSNPRFWYDVTYNKPPTLHGRRLLDAVREIMDIRMPVKIRRSVGGQLLLPFLKEMTA